MALLAKNLVRSNIGRSWMAIRDMDLAAEVIGFRPMHTKLMAFAVSSFYCGVAGALYAFAYLGTVEPEGFLLDLSFRILFMVIIGGLGSILGSFLGLRFHRIATHFSQRDDPLCRVDRGLLFAFRIKFKSRSDDFWRLDHFFPHRRAARAGQALADRQGKAAAVAVPALRLIMPLPDARS